MIKIVIVLFIIWAVGAVTTFTLHRIFLQMVTPGLALERALVWPIYLATGHPRGEPIPFD